MSRSVGILLTCMLLMTACSLKEYLGLSHANDLSKVSVSSTADCNQNNPVAYDLVLIFDTGAAATLSTMSAPQWFQQKEAMQLSLGSKIAVLSYDIVPLTSEQPITLPKNSRDATAVLLFANYLASLGQVAARIEGYPSVRIQFEVNQYQIIAGGKS
ncbi:MULTISPECIES: hypothetical protein [unclassified Agarivorans]|uniref:hypothetical protein n=1 Tax=unclassified Agarivorans TaxID=2636026 RepID=UPI003D7D134F